MVSQCTKFEVFRFTRHEATNGSAKCRKWCGFGWLGGNQGYGQCHPELSMGWVDPWVGLGSYFSVFGGLGWVHCSKRTKNLKRLCACI